MTSQSGPNPHPFPQYKPQGIEHILNQTTTNPQLKQKAEKIPQPSENDYEEFPRFLLPILNCLCCPICGDLFKEATTLSTCGHSFCYDCIASQMEISVAENHCPACIAKGDRVHGRIGNYPFGTYELMEDKEKGFKQYLRRGVVVKYDGVLDALVRKIFPRPQLDQKLEERRQGREEEDRKEIEKKNAEFRRQSEKKSRAQTEHRLERSNQRRRISDGVSNLPVNWDLLPKIGVCIFEQGRDGINPYPMGLKHDGTANTRADRLNMVMPQNTSIKSLRKAVAGQLNKHYKINQGDRKSTRLNSSHEIPSRMPSSA
eukprot:TRINITY_DN31401_c0_g3_i1.p1 TRINITY_DN31401_c0_g3~~TRINITY_DN31401_c0_g3_i1.p1  ORF type:complete len:327 (+),score=40.78 TRINITY_DN31401_c0_g3_i1:39-983(+)